MRPEKVFTDGLLQWLSTRGKRAAAPTDPYGTSLRNTERTIPWLRAVRIGNDIPLDTDRARNQAVTDMKALGGLLTGQRSSGTLQLTTFGAVLLQTWEDQGLVEVGREQEVGRCVNLIRLAALHHTPEAAGFQIMYHRWLSLRQIQPAEYWWQSVFHMMLPSYLDWTDPTGYNPFQVLVAVNGGKLGNQTDWEAWAADSHRPESAELSRLLNAIKDNHRLSGSIAFRQAMECIYLASAAPMNLAAKLQEWNDQ